MVKEKGITNHDDSHYEEAIFVDLATEITDFLNATGEGGAEGIDELFDTIKTQYGMRWSYDAPFKKERIVKTRLPDIERAVGHG